MSKHQKNEYDPRSAQAFAEWISQASQKPTSYFDTLMIALADAPIINWDETRINNLFLFLSLLPQKILIQALPREVLTAIVNRYSHLQTEKGSTIIPATYAIEEVLIPEHLFLLWLPGDATPINYSVSSGKLTYKNAVVTLQAQHKYMFEVLLRNRELFNDYLTLYSIGQKINHENCTKVQIVNRMITVQDYLIRKLIHFNSQLSQQDCGHQLILESQPRQGVRLGITPAEQNA